MPDEQDIIDFIRANVGSVWTLELLVLLAAEPQRAWSHRELVDRLRASDLIVVRAVDELAALRLIGVRPDRSIHYAPESGELSEVSRMAVELHERSPDRMRKTIVEAVRQKSARLRRLRAASSPARAPRR